MRNLPWDSGACSACATCLNCCGQYRPERGPFLFMSLQAIFNCLRATNQLFLLIRQVVVVAFGCHNICVLIQATHELGIEPTFGSHKPNAGHCQTIGQGYTITADPPRRFGAWVRSRQKAASAFCGHMLGRKRVIVYVDGFNLYYGVRYYGKAKWLDLDALCRLILPNYDIRRIKYFTAQVSASPHDVGKPQRQQTFWRALRTIPHLEIIEGHFISNQVDARPVNPIPGGPAKVKIMKTEEKGSDVNLVSPSSSLPDLTDTLHRDDPLCSIAPSCADATMHRRCPQIRGFVQSPQGPPMYPWRDSRRASPAALRSESTRRRPPHPLIRPISSCTQVLAHVSLHKEVSKKSVLTI